MSGPVEPPHPLRIALATVGTTGDVRPFLVLGRALAAAGHEVRIVTWPVHRAVVEAAGLAVETAGPHDDPARIAGVAEAAQARDAMGQVEALRDFHLEDGAAHYRRLLDVLAGHDLVLLHSIHALAHAAVMDLGVAWATAVFDPVLLQTRTSPPPGMPSLGPANGVAWWLLDRALSRVAAPLDAVLAEAGSSQRGLPLFRARSPRLHLVACSPSLVGVPPDLPASTHVTGAWVDRSPGAPLPAPVEAFLAAGAAPVVVTFGSMGAAFGDDVRSAVERLAAAGSRVVLQGPAATDHPSVLALGPEPIDHRALFPRAAVVVHHGGAGTTHTAVAAGVPSVVVPHVGDQRYWAARLATLGAAPAPVLPEAMHAGGLADVVRAAAADPALRARARSLATALAAEDGVGTAAALITGVVAAGR